jgi:hypothetical protein
MGQVPFGSLPGTKGALVKINPSEAVKAFMECSGVENAENSIPDSGADVAVADLHIASCEWCQIYLLAREQEKKAMH